MAIQMGSTFDLKQPDIASAVSTILLSAGAPVLRDGNSGKTIVFSPRHDGFATLFARLIRPIWGSKVTAPVVGGRQVLGVKEDVLLGVQGRLEGLRKYIDE
jgi:nuclear pore complex protein Nup155